MEIPVLRGDRTVGTRMGCTTGDGARGKRRLRRKENPPPVGSPPRDDRKEVGKSEGHASRKAAIVRHVPVPQTDTGG